ncbi:MAG: tRNA (guanosine(37)-N1)-methyltransferase TrmD [Spirochaetaceae bacterium]|nr:tRNA (guanosine(37)-N1)-methyltransferase TrmD [Spirochaetaceae bacterium]
MKYTVLSLFPEIIEGYFKASIMAKAVEKGLVEYNLVNIRDYAEDKHKTCDDAPYGGGAGMLMLAEPLGRALDSVVGTGCVVGAGRALPVQSGRRVIYMSPSGRPFTQALAQELSACDELVIICGRYEGIDQRIIDLYVDDEISVGDYVLSSGEVAALILIDATYRLLGEVIRPESLDEESFAGGLLEYPQWTRPEVYEGIPVPDVLLSGHHENIRKWRLKKQVEKTLKVRPDLIEAGIKNGSYSPEILDLIGETK